MDLAIFGLTLAASIRAVVLSFRKQYVLCIDGIKMRRSVTFTLKTALSPGVFNETTSKPQAFGTADGLRGVGHCVSTSVVG